MKSQLRRWWPRAVGDAADMPGHKLCRDYEDVKNWLLAGASVERGAP